MQSSLVVLRRGVRLIGNGQRGHLRSSRSLSSSGTGVEDFHITGTLLTVGPKILAYAQVRHAFSQAAVNDFAGICGDNNPLHTDPVFAGQTRFKGTIVHGILVSSLFSTLFGRAMHGSIYMGQTLVFKKPVHVGVTVTARMAIVGVEERKSGQVLTCSTECLLPDGSVAVEGEARVLLPPTAAPGTKKVRTILLTKKHVKLVATTLLVDGAPGNILCKSQRKSQRAH